MEITKYPKEIVKIKGFIDSEACAKLIALGEKMGFDEAAINTGAGQEIFKAIRNNERILFDDHSLAKDLFDKIKTYVPEKIEGWYVHSLNERFRFYRYEEGQYFKWHRDGSFVRNGEEASKVTFMIYLNDSFSGGNTEFREICIVKPEAGSALVFPHQLMHQGGTIESGSKYVLRTDVMYKKNA